MSQKDNELRIESLSQGHSHLIEANAGTGKTYAIANLFLRFVLEGIAVQNLLVVTFTRAATDELRGRIRKRLNQARLMLATNANAQNEDDFFAALPERYSQGKVRDEAVQRLMLALLDIHEAPIHTIHGFCQQALTDQAFSSGQSFELEQADDNEIKRRAMQDWWRQRTYKLERKELADFNQIFTDFDSLSERLEPLLKVPAPTLHPAPDEDISQAENELARLLKSLARLWQEQGDETRELLLNHTALSRTKSNGQNKENLTSVLDQLDKLLCQDSPALPQADLLQRIAHNQLQFKKTGKNISDFDREPFYQAELLLALMASLQSKRLVFELANACDYVLDQITAIKQRQGLLSFDDMIKQLHMALHKQDQAADELSSRLATQYPLILVDEFQDTDSLQYAIFKRIHAASNSHTLIMIGDPKQAIYAFRGGDIFTYMQARREADQHWSLSTNWRSTAEMIEAVNDLFSGFNTFTYTDIPYETSRPTPDDKCKARPLIIAGKPEPALLMQDLPRKDDGRTDNKDNTYAHVHQAVARRIAKMLGNSTAYIGEKRLRPADIAILVRTGNEASEVRQLLLEQGVRAVSVGKDNIWNSDEADGLRRLLEAALLPQDRQLLRQALSTPFLNLNSEELLAIMTSPQRWGTWVELIYSTGDLWHQRGFMPAFQALLYGLGPVLEPTTENNTAKPTSWLLNITDPERSLTNLFHLAELLQQASKEHPGGEALLAWMQQQQKRENQEEHQLRLESDEELVKIVTIHASKGLEFPVVFVPYLWSCRPADHKNNISMCWHEENNGLFHHYYSPWLDTHSPAINAAEHERLAEDVRLAYVALTRACSHCHVFFGAAGSGKGHAGQTALAWLLSKREWDMEQQRFEINPTDISLQSLTGKSNIKLIPAQQDLTPEPISMEKATAESLKVEQIKRKIRTNWHISSYSAMTRNVHQTTHISAKTGNEDFALKFEAGAHVGSFLHSLLEYIDPHQDLLTQIKRRVPSLSIRHGLDPKQDPVPLCAWIDNILLTPLNENSMTLAKVMKGHTLRELEFDLSANNVECKQLDPLLQKQSKNKLPPLNFNNFQGMITGVIDLVFEHAGKYFIADYKSNLLGRQLEDYTAEKLSVEIDARRYDLQYLIYTLALHRHLRQKIQDYHYERDFGGVYYLFLRAMRPESGTHYGVYFKRPDASLVEKLDNEIFAYKREKIV